jgi:hypothetical protein
MAKNLSQNLQPLGAGDLIDRSIRLYRQNFWTLLWIASPPIIVATFLAVGWTNFVSWLSPSSNNNSDSYIFYQALSIIGSFSILFIEIVATLIVMGGASRNFVRHLLWFEPLTFRETYSNVWKRLISLFFASVIIVFILLFIGVPILYIGLAFAGLAIIASALLAPISMILAVIVGTILTVAIVLLTLFLFFLIASRFAYVPQIILVEGQGVFSAIGRSFSLANGNVKRFGALFSFTILATYSALAILYIPLGWYAYLNGVDIFSFDIDTIPMWYLIANQLIPQVSLIFLSPIWMLGLSLLYVDERVRHEGYDIELMAARNLGEIPPLPVQYANPLQPALSQKAVEMKVISQKTDYSTLGLN